MSYPLTLNECNSGGLNNFEAIILLADRAREIKKFRDREISKMSFEDKSSVRYDHSPCGQAMKEALHKSK